MEIKAKIIDPIGLHARPAAQIVTVASKFESDIKLIHDGREANLKSIMSIMALGIKSGEEIRITAEGKDSADAITEIEAAMKQNELI